MDSKTAEFLTKLMLEDDEDDVVWFAFPNEKRKIKSSMSMLAEVSPVFEAMFSERWREKESDDEELASNCQDKTIQLDDEVNFNQYLTFKVFMQILYGLRQIESLSVDQAIGVYFYSHKYEIKDVELKIQKFLNDRMLSAISELPLSAIELKEGIEFAEMYQLDEFKNKLDQVKLAFDEKNPMQFWDLANKFELNTLKQQVVNHCKAVAPKEDWTSDILRLVITSFQVERAKIKNSKCVHCGYGYKLSCSTYCSGNGQALSSILPDV